MWSRALHFFLWKRKLAKSSKIIYLLAGLGPYNFSNWAIIVTIDRPQHSKRYNLLTVPTLRQYFLLLFLLCLPLASTASSSWCIKGNIAASASLCLPVSLPARDYVWFRWCHAREGLCSGLFRDGETRRGGHLRSFFKDLFVIRGPRGPTAQEWHQLFLVFFFLFLLFTRSELRGTLVHWGLSVESLCRRTFFILGLIRRWDCRGLYAERGEGLRVYLA